jgi:rare lipoprotein A
MGNRGEEMIKKKILRPYPASPNIGKMFQASRSGSPRFSSLFHLPYSLIIVVFLLSSCATPGPPPSTPRPSAPTPGEQTYRVMGQTYRVMGTSKGFVQRGEASWYGGKFHGRKTSSGEVYDMEKFTAAHRTLPLGTYVKVKRTDGKGESAVVKINDRGPFVNDRIIDLSRAAARQLQMLDEGVAPVEITALGEEIFRQRPGEVTLRPRYDYDRGSFSVQVGAFTVKENAQRLVNQMRNEHGTADLSLYDRGDADFFRVRVGRFSTREEAEEFMDKLIRSGEFDEAFVVAR